MRVGEPPLERAHGIDSVGQRGGERGFAPREPFEGSGVRQTVLPRPIEQTRGVAQFLNELVAGCRGVRRLDVVACLPLGKVRFRSRDL